jgi:hypothetical protein
MMKELMNIIAQWVQPSSERYANHWPCALLAAREEVGDDDDTDIARILNNACKATLLGCV